MSAGDTVDTVMTWFPSHKPQRPLQSVDTMLADTRAWWREWARACTPPGAYDEHVRRSLLVLRALTHESTGGIVAAPTTSLPEEMGGGRNWDYRYVWLRDAALTLESLMIHGYEQEASEWRDWLLRAIAGDPEDVQIMYGLSGERRLEERELTSLPGYRGSAPVRIGNGAFDQFQGDIFGEVMIALEDARELGVDEDDFSWSLQVRLLEYVETQLDRHDNGIWEIRGPLRTFTHSRAMLWAAFDRGIRGVREFGLAGPDERWEGVRDQLRAEIDEHGYDAERGHFVQHYETTEVDASLLQLAQVRFRSPTTTRACSAPSPRSSARCCATVCPCATARRAGSTGSLATSIRSSPAPSGWSSSMRGQGASTTPPPSWTAWSVSRTMSACCQRSTTSRIIGTWATTPQALSHLSLVRAADAIALARGTTAA